MTVKLPLALPPCYSLLILGCLFLDHPGNAAVLPTPGDTLMVSSLANAGPGSLRQAIDDNNALGGGRRILFSNTATGEIAITTTLEINADTVIVGPGAKLLTINANFTNRVFHIIDVAFSLSGLTIANGYGDVSGGGGILSVATYRLLKIEKCIFRNNRARGSGGALQSASSAVIVDSAFLENSAASVGGALFALDGAAVTNCTFIRNSATSAATGRGGAIFALNASGSSYIYSCTIISNTAGVSGGGVDQGGPLVQIGNSIVAWNSAPSAPDTGGFFFSQGYNLIGNSTSSIGWATAGGDQLGSDALPLDPLLGALRDNGGPTPTLAPQPGSPAIDKGKTWAGTADQRGRGRPYDNADVANAAGGDGSDIGAVEVAPAPRLAIDYASAIVVLSWPSYYAGYVLERTPALSASSNWAASPAPQHLIGDRWNVTNATAGAAEWFRLRSP
jgi:predicted outer membrane repeat protein